MSPTREGSGEPGTRLWRITIPVIATAGEMEALADRIVETLCPDHEHDGPCPRPWALRVTDGGSLSKAEQRRLHDEIDSTNDPPRTIDQAVLWRSSEPDQSGDEEQG